MTATYDCIATTTLTTATTSVTFSSISGNYTDLVLVVAAATTHSDSTFLSTRINSDTGSNYSWTNLYTLGSVAETSRNSNETFGWFAPYNSISTTLGDNVCIANFMNYSNTSTFKSWIVRNSRASTALDYEGTEEFIGLWRSTSAITSILIGNRRGGVDYNFASGSKFTLYGIKAE